MSPKRDDGQNYDLPIDGCMVHICQRIQHEFDAKHLAAFAAALRDLEAVRVSQLQNKDVL